MKNVPLAHKQVTVNGLTINVATLKECNRADWWVCARVADGPAAVASCQVAQCTICAEDIWFDAAMGLSQPPKICLQCIYAKTKSKTEWLKPSSS